LEQLPIRVPEALERGNDANAELGAGIGADLGKCCKRRPGSSVGVSGSGAVTGSSSGGSSGS
jgi:hypothetical protein